MNDRMIKIKGLGILDWDFDEMVPRHREDFALNFLLKLDQELSEWGNCIYTKGECVYGDPGFIPPKLKEIIKRLSMKYGEVELIRAPVEDDCSIRIKITVSQSAAKRIQKPTLFIISMINEINHWTDK